MKQQDKASGALLVRFSWATMALVATCASCANEDRLGGETNFVRACQVREDCGAGERCSDKRVCEAGYANPTPVPAATLADAGLDGQLAVEVCDVPETLEGLDGSLEALAGDWVGDLFGSHGLNGNPDVTLRLNAAALSGSLRFGDEVDIPRANEPDIGYLVDSVQLDRSGPDRLSSVPVVAGFEYTLQAGQLQADQVVLTFQPSEPWTEWCRLQSSVDMLPQWETDLWSCDRGALSAWPHELDGRCTGMLTDMDHFFETGDYRSDPSTVFEADCGKAALCDVGVCACTAESCRAATYTEVLVLRLVDDQLQGAARCGTTEIQGLEMLLERR